MLLCGAEVHRVEDTLCRMGRAVGAEKVNAFVITSSMVLTLTFADGQNLTETRRITTSPSNAFDRLERYNAISRHFCRQPVPAGELHEQILQVQAQTPDQPWRDYVGSMVAAGPLAVFFGGTVIDSIFAALFGNLIALASRHFRKYCPNTVTFNFLLCFALGILICLCGRVMPFLHIDKIMIGDIMLVIPGIAVTISVRDVLVGDTISGALRLLESVLWAAGIVYGFMLAIRIAG